MKTFASDIAMRLLKHALTVSKPTQGQILVRLHEYEKISNSKQMDSYSQIVSIDSDLSIL